MDAEKKKDSAWNGMLMYSIYLFFANADNIISGGGVTRLEIRSSRVYC